MIIPNYQFKYLPEEGIYEIVILSGFSILDY